MVRITRTKQKIVLKTIRSYKLEYMVLLCLSNIFYEVQIDFNIEICNIYLWSDKLRKLTWLVKLNVKT